MALVAGLTLATLCSFTPAPGEITPFPNAECDGNEIVVGFATGATGLAHISPGGNFDEALAEISGIHCETCEDGETCPLNVGDIDLGHGGSVRFDRLSDGWTLVYFEFGEGGSVTVTCEFCW